MRKRIKEGDEKKLRKDKRENKRAQDNKKNSPKKKITKKKDKQQKDVLKRYAEETREDADAAKRSFSTLPE